MRLERGGADMDIYQRIWKADMQSNGITPIFPGEKRDRSEGYVVVDHKILTPEHQLLKEVHIPEGKRRSYQLVEKLFDNYTLNQYSREKDTRRERSEVKEFLTTVVQSPPIKMAREYIEEKSNKTYSELQWFTHLQQLWFRKFDLESGRDISGFEHVFIGEQKRKLLLGHHFWYKYWLEDNGRLNHLHLDQIDMKDHTLYAPEPGAPYILTAGYRLSAFDSERKCFVKISKSRCGFFVGISPEGLLALGTVRAMFPENAPHFISFNGTSYKLELFMSPDGKSIRTFYPYRGR
jgi:poly(U)-specific endoribonuclease